MVTLFGGTGFIGSHFNKKFASIIVDKNDYVPKTDTVLYLISTGDNYNIYTNPHLDIDTNLTILIKVLENCKRKNITFNFASSWFVYGDKKQYVDENAPCDPIGFYSITKRTAEQLLIEYCHTFNIKYRILRFSNVLGKDDKNVSKKKNVLTYLINQLKTDNEIELFQGGEFYRDYIHVSDLCDAVKLVMDKGKLNTVYNIGNEMPILFKDAILYAAEKLGKVDKVKIVDKVPENIIKPKSLYLNCHKLFDLGYSPKYTIKDMVDELLA
jgi:nucleoside-diphosphate-sugar epimerase